MSRVTERPHIKGGGTPASLGPRPGMLGHLPLRSLDVTRTRSQLLPAQAAEIQASCVTVGSAHCAESHTGLLPAFMGSWGKNGFYPFKDYVSTGHTRLLNYPFCLLAHTA